MTKYILHGGNTSVKSESNKRFFYEILKDLPSPVDLLIIYFAIIDEAQWQDKFKEDKTNFSLANPDKKII